MFAQATFWAVASTALLFDQAAVKAKRQAAYDDFAAIAKTSSRARSPARRSWGSKALRTAAC